MRAIHRLLTALFVLGSKHTCSALFQMFFRIEPVLFLIVVLWILTNFASLESA